MAKLGDFEGFGIKGNLFNVSDLTKPVIAVAVGLTAFALGQTVKGYFSKFSPIETNIESPMYTPQTKNARETF